MTKQLDFSTHRLCVAPMMDLTDKHCRFLMRLLSKRTRLYTEMIHCNALLYRKQQSLLAYNPEEQPLAIQLGGSVPEDLATASAIAEQQGYREVNLNVGCPSERVQNGRFGACLMVEPEQVAKCIARMKNGLSIPVTVKCRTGVDELDSYADLRHFIEIVAASGCNTFIIHARKAWLKGLSPKQNRTIPPLQYQKVYAIKQDFPLLKIVINGGVNTLEQALQHLHHVDGVMMGRSFYENPFLLANADHLLFCEDEVKPSRAHILAQFIPYVEKNLMLGSRPASLTRHLLGLFHGMPGAKFWRRQLSGKLPEGKQLLILLEEISQQVGDSEASISA